MRIRNAATNAIITQFYLSKSNANLNNWRHVEVQMNQLVGVKFKIQLFLQSPNGGGQNDGKGWFIDNILIDQKPVAENCGDGLDNDGNGKVDCDDQACIAGGGCVEHCSNGEDDDYDDKIDCDDSDCTGKLDCVDPTISWDFACGDKGWTYSKGGNNVTWAIDATPVAVKPYTGKCTMNYNNGTNYCGVSSCNGQFNWSAGIASYDMELDATAFKQLKLAYWSYMDVSPFGSSNDNGYVQVSTSDFAGCCGATNQCSSQEPNNCNKGGTASFAAPKGSSNLKKWVKVELDLAAYAGKKFNLRLRFNSSSSGGNNYPGWFVDDMRLYGIK